MRIARVRSLASPPFMLALPLFALLQAEEAAAPIAKPAGNLVIQPEIPLLYCGDAVPLRWRFTNGLTVPMQISWDDYGPSPGDVTWIELDAHGPPMVAFPRSSIPGGEVSAPDPIVAAGATFTGRFFLNRFFPSIPAGRHRLSWTQTIHCGYRDRVLEERITCTGEFTIDIQAGRNPDAQKMAQDLYQAVVNGDDQARSCLSWLCYMDTPESLPYLRSFVDLGNNRLISGEPFEAVMRLIPHPEAQRLFEDILRWERTDLIRSGLHAAFARHELIQRSTLHSLLSSSSNAIVAYTLDYLELVIAAASKERVRRMLDSKELPLDDIAALLRNGRCKEECAAFLSMIGPPPPQTPSPATDQGVPVRQPAGATVDTPAGRPDPAANGF